MDLEYQCGCCDYFTVGVRGEWEICPVCFWEDDGFELDDLDSWSGANHGPVQVRGHVAEHQMGANK